MRLRPLRRQPLGEAVVVEHGPGAPAAPGDGDGAPAPALALLRVRRTVRLVAHRVRLYTPVAADTQRQPVRRDGVRAGEQAGALETLLDKIATYKEKTEAIKKKIKKALFYPAAVVVVAIVVTAILMIFVIPEFESLFQGFGADLPAFW